MNRIIKLTIVMLAIAQLCGCADLFREDKALNVTYKTDLAGATLMQGDQYLGTTPITRTQCLTPEQYAQGCLTLPPMTLQWASGVCIEVPAETIIFANGLRYEFTYVRPKNAPNLQLDINMAQLEEAKQTRIAAEQRATALEFQNQLMLQRIADMEHQRQWDEWERARERRALLEKLSK